MAVEMMFRDGVISVMQMPHPDKGNFHIFTKPTPNGLLYYVGWRRHPRTHKLDVLAGGFRSRNKAIKKLFTLVKTHKIRGYRNKDDKVASRVYSWEETCIDVHFSNEYLTNDQVLALVYRVYGDLRLPPPAVEFIKGCPFCYYWKSENNHPIFIFSDQKSLRITSVVLHEIAHHLGDLESPNLENHGAIFMKHYIYLLNKYASLDMKSLTETLREHKIKYYLPA